MKICSISGFLRPLFVAGPSYEQVLGALVYGGDHKRIKVLRVSHHLIWHKGEVTLTLKFSQLIKFSNHQHKEGRQASLPSTPHSRAHISGKSPGLAAASQSLLIIRVQCTPMKGRRHVHVVSAAQGRLHSLRGYPPNRQCDEPSSCHCPERPTVGGSSRITRSWSSRKSHSQSGIQETTTKGLLKDPLHVFHSP